MVSWSRKHALAILSRLIAIYFIWAFHLHVGFPPIESLSSTAATYLAVFVFFLVLPFAQRVSLGKLIEFEAKVEKVQADVKEVRTETRELISTISVVANALSASMSQNVVVNIPNMGEAQEAREELSEAIEDDPDPSTHERNVQDYLEAGEADIHYALARLRMDLERELRRVLRERVKTDVPLSMQGRHLAARPLFRRLVSAVPRYKNMQSSFDYVLKVCNAAIHGQKISEGIALEAVDMGLRLLRELEKEAALVD